MPEQQTKKGDIDKFQALPQEVRDFLMDEKSSDANVKIVEKFKLSPIEEDLFFDLTDKVIYKELKLEDFFAEVKTVFKFDEKKAKDFALEILGTIFLPIDSYLGDVQGEIKKMGATAGNFAVEKIKTEELTPEMLTKRIVVETGIGLESALAKKFEDIILNRFRGVRDEAETLETLKRGKKLGGLEMGEEDAKKISLNLEAKLKSVKIIEPRQNFVPQNLGGQAEKKESDKKIIKKTVKPIPDGVDSPNKSGNDNGGVAKKADLAFGAEDEREVLHISHQLEKRGVETKTDLGEEIKKSTEKIAKYGKITFTDENLKSKFGNIVSARLRDIRDEMETMEILTRDKGVGGLGLAPEAAKTISGLIETEFQLLSEARKAREFKKNEEWKQMDGAERATREEGLKAAEQKKLDDKYQKITSNSFRAKTVKSPTLNNGEIAQVKSEPVTRPVEFSRPVTPSGKPLVEDISFTPKLLGPIDELKKMTLVDFRRFGKNPSLSAEKIKDKIDLLEDESHLKKIEGLRAWRESEVAKNYFEIMRQSINDGKSIDEIIATRNAGKIPSLTPDEFRAVMKLSEDMRV
jgi:hypothetical protein